MSKKEAKALIDMFCTILNVESPDVKMQEKDTKVTKKDTKVTKKVTKVLTNLKNGTKI